MDRTQTKTKRPDPELLPPELVERAKDGDQAAFTELYERTSAMVYRTIRSMVRDEDLVWDVQQNAYLRAWRKLGELRTPGAFLPWLRRIAVNETARAMEKRLPLCLTELGCEEDEPEQDVPDLRPAVQPELALDRKETARLVRELLASLPEQQQLILGMRYYEEMPVKDIAALLQVSTGTVKTQLSRGRKRVEAGVRALEQQGVRLCGMAPLPFLLALLRGLEPAEGMEQRALAAVLSKTTGGAAAGTAATGTAAAGSAAAGEAAVKLTALTAGQAFLHGIAGKLVAGALALALIGGGKLFYDALQKGGNPLVGPEQPGITELVRAGNTDDAAANTNPTELSGDAIPENACGPNLTWFFDESSGTLTIMGSGDMYDYTNLTDSECTPWFSFREEIRNLILPDGLSSIGMGAFHGCPVTEVVIPEGVRSIGKEAFDFSVTSLQLPDTLTTIGDCAFFGCSELSSLTIPESVSSIGRQAFSGTGLSSVTIPEHVREISGDAFSMNARLAAFYVHPDNPYFSADENGVLYNKDRTTLVACPGQNSGHFEIPEGVTAIGDGAFYYCSRLSSVTIPESVVSIGENAFSSCRNLSSIVIPAGVRSIESWTFSYCWKLSSVTIPKSVSYIGEGAFLDCEDLTIYGYADSAAEAYAEENGIPFVAMEP